MVNTSRCAPLALALIAACDGGSGSSEPPDARVDAVADAGVADTGAADAGAADGAATDAHVHGSVDAGWVASPSLAGLPPIESEFDIDAVLAPAWGTGAIPGPYGDGIAEGAFRLLCEPAQLLYDDPLVYPGRPGASHLHQFFGNVEADAHSTFESLRTTGGSTCNWVLDASGELLPIAANRSAYWVPALLDGYGNVVRPDYLTVYYKRHTEAAGCRPAGQSVPIATCVPLPHGLRYIFGRDMADLEGSLDHGYHYRCDAEGTGHYRNLEEVLAICPEGHRVIGWASAPDCWDGMHLDSPNHRDHMAYREYLPDGSNRCPETHPYLIPQFELGQSWNVDGLDRARLHLASDAAAPDEPRGSTYHADWFGAWDDEVLGMWTDHCIEMALSGSGGDLCNGRALRGASQPRYGWSHPERLVPIPPRP